ncbi:hypothetical protein [Cohnella mopanensis]|uniref:hypothetical protein n=1 Tax=Cohnella mopanensis TaxID=2911966 RepID=UPI001EF90264|nr:hypothetical protein [Cohnella mopanensis]
MSFVSVLARESFLCVMSDGQVTNLDGVTIIQEDFQKFTSLMDGRAFIAFAGTKDLCEMIIRDTQLKDRNFSAWKDLFLLVFKALNLTELHKTHNYKVMLAFGGINESDEIEVYSISSIDKNILHQKPKGDNTDYSFLNNTSHSNEFWEKKLIELFRETGYNTPSELVSAQKLLNNFVADNENSVNKKTFKLVIKK